ncbi:STAS domain-containing protein [uncultured Lacinutrix sp.]|jgi:anti-anti-sigma regulatory factor|uniref:STAS domain-containing protein n=1 Tax=uncultured Lacinutrix sp. TaxID=574032 RepID=UPI00260E45F0|nr:STAS domain-containing protein [uncultured Lacinutrix sp.]
MALTISQQDNTITLEGKLNATTVRNFKMHFGLIQNPFRNLTIDFDKVTEIDESALYTLKEMYKNEALKSNPFFVTGFRSEEIYEDYQFSNIA